MSDQLIGVLLKKLCDSYPGSPRQPANQNALAVIGAHVAALESRHAAVVESYKKSESEISRLETYLAQREQEIKRLRERLESSEAEVSRLTGIAAKFARDHTECETLREEMAKAKALETEMKQELANDTAEIAKKDAELEAAAHRGDLLRDALKITENQVRQIDGDLTEVRGRLQWWKEHTEQLEKNWEALVEIARSERDAALEELRIWSLASKLETA